MTGTAEQTQTTATRNFMMRYAQVLQGPKTPEHLRELIADEALLAHIEEAEAAFPGYPIEVEDLVVEESKAVLRGRLRGVQRGDFHGVRASGRPVDVPIFVLYDVQHEQIVRHSMVLDTLSLMQQIGAISQQA